MEYNLKKKSNKTRNIIIFSIIALLLITLGASYAMYSKSMTGHDTKVIAGDIYMRYINGETKAISMIPSDTYNEDDYYEFTISGKNTSNKDIVYDIKLNHGENYNNPYIRLDDKYLRFRLVRVDNNQETEIIDKISYEDITNKTIHVATINKNGTNDVNTTYRLYTWVEGVIVGNVNQTYTTEQWSNVYTNIKVDVTGDFVEKERDATITIDFNPTGGSVNPTSKIYTTETTYGELPIPTKSNNEFLGWYKEITFDNIVESTTPLPSSNTTLYAKWNEEAYIINLSINNPTNTPTNSLSVSMATNEITPNNIVLPESNYTVSGFSTSETRKSNGAVVSSTNNLSNTTVLDGYYTEETGGVKVINGNTNLSLIPNVSGYTNASGEWIKRENTTLYARYIEESTKIELPTITKTNYTCGWTNEENGTTIVYQSGETVKPNNNLTLYGVCSANTYQVSLDKNDGTTQGTESITTTYESNVITPSTISLSSKSYTISGFTLDATRKSNGATVSSNSSLTSIGTLDGYYTDRTNGYKVLDGSTTPTLISNVTGYTDTNSKWIRNENTTLYARFNNMSSVTLPTISKTGYICGWTTNENGTTIMYESGKTNYIPEDNTILYGVCEVNTYTITYNLDGGTATNPTSYTIESNAITLNNPTKEGYTFTGWTGSNGNTPQTTITIQQGSTGNKTYTANYEPTNYTISYTLNGGTATNPTSYTIESNAITLNNPTKTGYIFTGWTGSNGTTVSTSVSIPTGSTGNKTYTANYRVDAITGLSFSPTNSSIYVGQTTTTSVTKTGGEEDPNNDRIYTSSDTSIATVDANGVITGTRGVMTNSSTSITVKVYDYEGNEYSASLTITVLPLFAENIRFTPTQNMTCNNGGTCDVQTILEEIAGMLE